MERYTIMYPSGQLGLPDDPVMAYVNDLRATGASSGSTTTRRPPTTRPRDPSASATFAWCRPQAALNPEPAQNHCATNTQRRARLDELVEARR
jgi:hypothetical protein